MTNCPNCGAPITGAECEYCGTVFESTPVSTTLYYDNIPVKVRYVRKRDLEKERLRLENELIRAKTQALKDQATIKELYSEALKAMCNYARSY